MATGTRAREAGSAVLLFKILLVLSPHHLLETDLTQLLVLIYSQHISNSRLVAIGKFEVWWHESFLLKRLLMPIKPGSRIHAENSPKFCSSHHFHAHTHTRPKVTVVFSLAPVCQSNADVPPSLSVSQCLSLSLSVSVPPPSLSVSVSLSLYSQCLTHAPGCCTLLPAEMCS